MYHHILVPLDGSKAAEQVLSHLQDIVQPDGDTRITLLHAVPFGHAPTIEFGGSYRHGPSPLEEMAQTETVARTYLDRIASRLRSSGYNVQTEISKQNRVRAVLNFAQQHGVDLITVAPQGHGWLSHWLQGNPIERIVNGTHVPVLVIRPKKRRKA